MKKEKKIANKVKAGTNTALSCLPSKQVSHVKLDPPKPYKDRYHHVMLTKTTESASI
jgi:hypothetical protein